MQDDQLGLVSLGRALDARGAEISHTIVGLWEQRCSDASAADPRIKDDIARTTQAATNALTAYFIYGLLQTPEQKQAEARTGKAPLRESISLADLTKLYLFWRETTIEILRSEGRRLELDQSTTNAAVEIVRAASDASIVRMVKSFDSERGRLQQQLQHEQELLAHEAMHDALTGLPNRKLFFDRLTQALARVRRNPSSVGVLFIDIDHFKTVNDTWGHRVGDQLLIAVAGRLRDRVRPNDTVARLAGDEFVVLYERVDESHEDGALQARIEDTFRLPFSLGAHVLHISASVGFAAATTDCDPDILLTQADHDMYRAKQCSAAKGAFAIGSENAS